MNCGDLNCEDDPASVHGDIFGDGDDSVASVQDPFEEAGDNGVGSVEAWPWTLDGQDRCRDRSRGVFFECV